MEAKHEAVGWVPIPSLTHVGGFRSPEATGMGTPRCGYLPARRWGGQSLLAPQGCPDASLVPLPSCGKCAWEEDAEGSRHTGPWCHVPAGHALLKAMQILQLWVPSSTQPLPCPA